MHSHSAPALLASRLSLELQAPLPQGLRTVCSSCQECSSPRSPHMAPSPTSFKSFLKCPLIGPVLTTLFKITAHLTMTKSPSPVNTFFSSRMGGWMAASSPPRLLENNSSNSHHHNRSNSLRANCGQSHILCADFYKCFILHLLNSTSRFHFIPNLQIWKLSL